MYKVERFIDWTLQLRWWQFGLLMIIYASVGTAGVLLLLGLLLG